MGLVRISAGQRMNGLVPSLYSTNVRYAREPQGVDCWCTALETFRAGNGDCEDLAIWLCSDAILDGDPKAHVVIKPIRPGLAHAMVITHVNGKTFLRDPSRKLGMRGRG